MPLANPKIAQANPDSRANAAYINALFQEAYGRAATTSELKKFEFIKARDAANIILGAGKSPFSTKKTETITLRNPLSKLIVTQGFGEQPGVYGRFGLKGHNGIDFRTKSLLNPFGIQQVFAAHDGVVEVRWDKTGYGTHVRLYKKGFGTTIYAHLSKALVANKQQIKAGEILGMSGNTGFSSAPHLHFEFRPEPLKSKNGYAGATDPSKMLHS